jgi:hypothetical protein
MAAIKTDRARSTVYRRQRIACLVAAAALLVAATAPGAIVLSVPGIVLAALAVPAWRGRAPVAWIGTGLGYASRARHTYASGGFLPVVAPDATVVPLEISGTDVGAIADRHGLAAIVEIGDPDALLVTGEIAVPLPAELAGSPTPAEPAATTQVVVVRRAQFQRLFVAVRVGGDGVGWTDAQLRRALSAAVRGVVRRLARSGVTGHVLSMQATARTVSWAVNAAPYETVATETVRATVTLDAAKTVNAGGHSHGAHAAADVTTIDERWDHLRVGAAEHVVAHVTVRIGLRADRLSSELLARLLAAPATAVALSISDEQLLMRVAAPTTAALAVAVAGVMAACPGAVRQLDGEQRAGLVATLPVGVTGPATPVRGNATRTHRGRARDEFALPSRPVTAAMPAPPPLALPDVGLLLGRDRRGAQVFLQLDPHRRTPIRLAVVGGPAAARVLSGRLRALGAPHGGSAAVPVAMAVLERLTPADSATLASADVVVCQPVSQPEAALVASALRLTRAGAWLSRIDGDMIAIISHGAVRWAQLSAFTGKPRRLHGLAGLAGVAGT